VRLAVRTGDAAAASRRFEESLAFIESHDPHYAAAWYIVECVPELAALGAADLWKVVDRYGATVQGLGLAMLTERYAALARYRPESAAVAD